MLQEKTSIVPKYTEVAFAEIWRSSISAVKYLLRKWWIILISSIVGGLFGVWLAWKEKPKFQSKLTFALEESGGSMGSALSLAAEFGFNIGGGKDIFEGDNITQIFSSRRMIERVLLSADTVDGKIMTFADNYVAIENEGKKAKKPSRLDSISYPVGLERGNFTYLQDSVLYVLYDNLVNNNLIIGKPDKKLDIFEIQFISHQERFSKVFVENLVKETTEFYTELRSKRSRETLEILENRVAQLKGSLNAAITDRTSVQDANINPAFAAAQAPLQKKQVDIQVYGGAYGELYKNLELARYQYLKTIPLLQIIDEPRYPMKKIKKGRFSTGIIYGIVASLLCILALLIGRQWRTIKSVENEKVI